MSVTIKSTTDERALMPALKNGAMCKCPKCGEGKLFSAYLKTDEACSSCHEDLSHHRADDLPPYIAIIIVGHLLVGIMMHMEMTWTVNPMTYVAILVPLSIILPLAMLPSIKGCVVALQWAKRMHGFDPNQPDFD